MFFDVYSSEYEGASNTTLDTKVDKSPTGTRFIIASEQCLIKPLRKKITGYYYSKQQASNLIFCINLVIEKQISPPQHPTFQHYIPTYQMINLLKH